MTRMHDDDDDDDEDDEDDQDDGSRPPLAALPVDAGLVRQNASFIKAYDNQPIPFVYCESRAQRLQLRRADR